MARSKRKNVLKRHRADLRRKRRKEKEKEIAKTPVQPVDEAKTDEPGEQQ